MSRSSRVVVGVMICVLGALLSSPSSYAQVTGDPTRDVPFAHPAYDAVQRMIDLGIMAPYPDRTFKGDEPVARYGLAAALARLWSKLPSGPAPPGRRGDPGARGPAGAMGARGPAGPPGPAPSEDQIRPLVQQEVQRATGDLRTAVEDMRTRLHKWLGPVDEVAEQGLQAVKSAQEAAAVEVDDQAAAFLYDYAVQVMEERQPEWRENMTPKEAADKLEAGIGLLLTDAKKATAADSLRLADIVAALQRIRLPWPFS